MAKSVKQPVEMSPYLKQVRIRDYAPMRDAKVSFKPGLNIIIGNNGAGKTRFLSLVGTLLRPFEGPAMVDGCEFVIQAKEKFTVLFQEKLEPAERGKRISRLIPYLLVRVGEGKQVHASYLMEAFEQLVDDEPFYNVLSIQHGVLASLLPIVYEPINLTFSKQGILKMEGNPAHISFENRAFFVLKMLDAIETGVQAANFYSKDVNKELSVIDVKHAVILAIESQLLSINENISNYSPIQSVRHSESLQVYFNAKQEEFLINGVVLEYQVDNTWLPFTALSDGTKRAFYLISELQVPSFTDINKTNEGTEVDFHDEPKIIFLEEPELGIHPEQLHKLLSLIREVSREHQVIMTTHSPQVLDMLSEKELDRITICELDPKKGTQFRKLSKAKQDEARAYMREKLHLSDYWRYSYLEEKD